MKKIYFISICVLSSLFVQSQSWRNIGPGAGSDLHFVVIQPDNKDVIYAGGDIEGIFKTTDGGITWNNINNNLAQLTYGTTYWINHIRIDPVNYQKVYICTGTGLFVTNNGGQNWQLLYPATIDSISNPPVLTSDIAIDSENTNRLFLGLGDETSDCSMADYLPFNAYDGQWGVYRSLNGGVSWTLTSNGLPDSISVHTIEVISNSDTIILSSNSGVFRSDDGGNSWIPKNNGLPHNNIHEIIVTNDFGSYILTLSLKTLGDITDSTTFNGGIFRSYDFGDSWDDITGNLPQYDVYDSMFYDYWKFDILPDDPSVIYTATNRGSGYYQSGIYATYDEGTTWDLLYTPQIGGWIDSAWFWDGYANDIKFAPSDPSRMVISLIDIEISNDTGYTWNQVFTTQVGNAWKGNGLELMNTESIAFDPINENKSYIGYDDMGLFRSDDNANSFIRLDYHQDPTFDNLSDIDAVKEIYIDPVANNNVYVERFQGSQGGYLEGWTGGGIVFSTDEGVSFTDITGSMPNGRHDIAVDFTSGTPENRIIYSAVFHNGVYKSTDNGNSWININTGLGTDAQYAWDIVINPNNNQEIFLALNSWGLNSGALYKSVNGGTSWTKLNSLAQGDVSKVYINNLGDLYAGVSNSFELSTSGGLYRSTDGGNTFTKIFNYPRIIDVQVNPYNPNFLVIVAQPWYNVTSQQHGIYLSDNNGSTWSLISQNVNHTFFNFARFNPNKPEQIYAGTGGGGLWVCDSIANITYKSELFYDNKFYFYPNPVINELNIVCINAKNEETKYEIFTIEGKNIKELVSKDNNLIISTNDLNKGIYILKITNKFITNSYKFIK